MNPFAFNLGDHVTLVASGEAGTVEARSESRTSAPIYLVRYRAGDGRATEQWWTQDALRLTSPSQQDPQP